MPEVMETTVYDETIRKEVVVGWDHCSSCNRHLSRCRCEDGPTEPSYITNWNTLNSVTSRGNESVRAPGTYKMPEVKRVERHPDGRKVRADKGLKRTAQDRQENPGMPAPCAIHTAESKANSDGTFECTVLGCPGVQ